MIEQKIAELKAEVASFEKTIDEIKYKDSIENENLSCCGNCDHCKLRLSEDGDCWFPLCKISSERIKHFNYCSCWKFDGMTREQREI